MRRLLRSCVIVALTITATIGAMAAPAVASAFAPTVYGISPNAGPTAGGNVVHISGNGLDGTTAVRFGSVSATGIVNISSAQVDATAPAGSGLVDVTVTTAA